MWMTVRISPQLFDSYFTDSNIPRNTINWINSKSNKIREVPLTPIPKDYTRDFKIII